MGRRYASAGGQKVQERVPLAAGIGIRLASIFLGCGAFLASIDVYS